MGRHMRPPCVVQLVHVRVCAHVCARVCLIKDKAPCLGFSLTPQLRTPYILTFSFLFLLCGTLFHVLSVHVMWQHDKRPMDALKMNRQSSLTEGGMWRNPIHLQIIFKLIKSQPSIQGIIMAEIKTDKMHLERPVKIKR